MKATLYPSIEYVHRIHDEIIILSGWLSWIKNTGLIESVLVHIQNNDYYPSFLDKLTHLTFGLVQNHGYNDANKRTALAIGGYFIYINRSPGLADDFIKKMENVVVLVAAGSVSKDMLKDIIENFLEQEEEQKNTLYHILEELDGLPS